MTDVTALVREFHEKFRLPMSDTPALVDPGLARQRHQILLKEVTEAYDAVLHSDLPGIAQELADCVYVLYGTALTYGIELDSVLAAVHAANMSKLGDDGAPIMQDGKVLKGPNYVKPDIAAVLARQGMQAEGRGFGPEHMLIVDQVKTGPVEWPMYHLEHPVECDRLKYGQRCSLDALGDDQIGWPTEPGAYRISSWSSKTWTDVGWEYDAGVQWDRVVQNADVGQAQGKRDLAGDGAQAPTDVA